MLEHMTRFIDFIQISTTVAKKSDAEKIADVLSRKKLSACAHIIGPITSMYRWKGKFEKSREWLCVIKTKRINYSKVEKAEVRVLRMSL